VRRLRETEEAVMRQGIVVVVLSCLCVLAGCSCECECDTLEQNKAVVMKFAEIINSHDYSEMHTVVADDYVRHCQATPDVLVESRDDFVALLERWDTEIPDGTIEVVLLAAEGDLVGMWGTYSGTQTGPMGPFPATGNYAKADFGGFHRVVDGKVVETWVTWDNVAMLTQLGLFPMVEG
jgi:steroid delta-isomerase-like uncharacterized protein